MTSPVKDSHQSLSLHQSVGRREVSISFLPWSHGQHRVMVVIRISIDPLVLGPFIRQPGQQPGSAGQQFVEETKWPLGGPVFNVLFPNGEKPYFYTDHADMSGSESTDWWPCVWWLSVSQSKSLCQSDQCSSLGWGTSFLSPNFFWLK